MAESRTDYNLASVKNALRILRYFTEDEPEQTVASLSQHLGTSKSTTSRLLSTLASEGFVTKVRGTHKFRLGIFILSLNNVITSSLEIHKEAAPVLEELVKETNETAHLAILEGFSAIYLHKVECNQPVRMMSNVGKPNPLYCTSSGKALLAYKDEKFIKEVIERGLEKHTPYTITDPETLISKLKQIKKQGYAIDIEELLTGVTSIAAPVRDYTNEVIAVVNIVGPIQRIHEENISFYIEKVVKASQESSKRLGYIGKG